MTAKTSTEKARTLREKRAREGLAEVRGVWWPAHEHAQFKSLVKAAPDLLSALQEIADDYADRFDMDSPSTNPGIKYVVKQARAAIKATEPAQRMRKEGKTK